MERRVTSLINKVTALDAEYRRRHPDETAPPIVAEERHLMILILSTVAQIQFLEKIGTDATVDIVRSFEPNENDIELMTLSLHDFKDPFFKKLYNKTQTKFQSLDRELKKQKTVLEKRISNGAVIKQEFLDDILFLESCIIRCLNLADHYAYNAIYIKPVDNK